MTARAVPVVRRASGFEAAGVVARPREQDGDRGDSDAEGGGGADERGPSGPQSFAPRSRSALPITDTDERLIARSRSSG